MAYQQCTLGSYTYPVNPKGNTKDPPIRAVSRVKTWNGMATCDWGSIPQDRTIEQTWEYLDPSIYAQFKAFMIAGGTYSFVDEEGNASTVVIAMLTYDTKTPVAYLYANVVMTLWPQ